MARAAFLENSLIVGAHADDELLWFGSILPEADEAIVVFRDFWAHPDLGRRRMNALADHPHPRVTCLGISESGAYGCADWPDPVLDENGIAFRAVEPRRREATRLARLSMSKVSAIDPARVALDSVVRSYAANTQAIYQALKPRLRADMNVFTHNPWGEYGHEEHVQVFRVLDRLRQEIGFRLWMSNYCTERALPLAMRYFSKAPGPWIRLPVDKAFADKVADAYKRHDCWTWSDDWAWFDEECFMEAPRRAPGVQSHAHLFPLNFFVIDGQRGRTWLPLALTMTVASAAIGATLAETF